MKKKDASGMIKEVLNLTYLVMTYLKFVRNAFW